MASNRHLGRVIVLQSLYEYELRTLAKDKKADLSVIIAKNIVPYEKALGDTEFVYNLATKVAENFETLDKVLAPIAPEWPIEAIAAIDRNVLRMGLYELSECRESIPPKVAINEAVELAKEFGSENSSRFVNGVLGTAYKQLNIKESENYGEQNKPAEEKDGGSSEGSTSKAAKQGDEAAEQGDGAAKKASSAAQKGSNKTEVAESSKLTK